jgi:hypothetical protein
MDILFLIIFTNNCLYIIYFLVYFVPSTLNQRVLYVSRNHPTHKEFTPTGA